MCPQEGVKRVFRRKEMEMFRVEICFLNPISPSPFFVLYYQVTASILIQCVFMSGNTFLNNKSSINSEVKQFYNLDFLLRTHTGNCSHAYTHREKECKVTPILDLAMSRINPKGEPCKFYI